MQKIHTHTNTHTTTVMMDKSLVGSETHTIDVHACLMHYALCVQPLAVSLYGRTISSACRQTHTMFAAQGRVRTERSVTLRVSISIRRLMSPSKMCVYVCFFPICAVFAEIDIAKSCRSIIPLMMLTGKHLAVSETASIWRMCAIV